MTGVNRPNLPPPTRSRCRPEPPVVLRVVLCPPAPPAPPGADQAHVFDNVSQAFFFGTSPAQKGKMLMGCSKDPIGATRAVRWVQRGFAQAQPWGERGGGQLVTFGLTHHYLSLFDT